MMENLQAALEKRISTDRLADMFGVKSQTIRRSLCINGNYYGLTPMKMPNGRLMWKYSEALELIKQ
jgi:hypothetical protein